MSLFYKPIAILVNQTPVIVYPMKGIESLVSRSELNSITDFLSDLYSKHPILQSGTFHIAILWSDQDQLMTDLWIYRSLESSEAGFTIDCQTFRGTNSEKGEGITASDGLIMLGRETELEEAMRSQGKTIHDYVFGPRPKLPGVFHPTESYYS